MSEMASLGGILNYYPEKMLEFNVVGGSQSQVTLQLENPSDTHVAFKIKTTAPKSYLVKPSSGVVPPNGRQQISILLIPLYEPPRESTPDRFLVQSTVIANAEPLSKEAWADLAVMKEKLHEKRLSVHLNWMGYGSTQTSKLSFLDLMVMCRKYYAPLRRLYLILTVFQRARSPTAYNTL
eukprot:Blabericola_migrator_1__4990@NODE_2593_length_2561_cov_173_171612_g1625_i0_p3_GENE_NODE_2593_length_2561_cov_173_171612_g1625_i0NODE_2593_length_2561_cov_173_171612_g1625_i0_p3_ORF_typecomplete_len180_score23_29Motile_Sperm/PF00635_26/1_4e26PapDlike/PF14874_6/0_0004DUF5001/PF16392_5/0_012ASH/PF15780_5/0_014PapD_N/PF00345_20/0_058TMEM131_like/PF12371_8/0_098DUF1081/PF06448_11/4_5e02DUF1081/PF06448_11/1_5Ice_nucleation/PF00818_17/0_75_NODE_2593_length_2561_cov_173_171612_g1625_i0100639